MCHMLKFNMGHFPQSPELTFGIELLTPENFSGKMCLSYFMYLEKRKWHTKGIVRYFNIFVIANNKVDSYLIIYI